MPRVEFPESSAIEAIEWRGDGVEVWFTSGHEYFYERVEEEVYEAWLKAESKGKFYHANIKEYYPSQWIPFNDWRYEK